MAGVPKDFNRDDFFKFLLDAAVATLESSGSHEPMFFLVTEKGVAAVMAPFTDDRSKDAVMGMIGKLCKEQECELYYTVNDAWMASPQKMEEELRKRMQEAKTEEDIKKAFEFAQQMQDGLRRPSQAPNRQEVLIICEYSKKDGMRMMMAPYKRDGDKILLDEVQGPSYQTMKTRFNIWGGEQIVEDDEGEAKQSGRKKA